MQLPSQWLGMHFRTGASATPQYNYGTVRSIDSGVDWWNIETSNGVYNWTSLDNIISHFNTSLGHDFYYQITSCPTFHATGSWASVADYNNGRVGSCAVPDPVALNAFVTALMNRYGSKIKYLSPWNEPKLDAPIVNSNGTITGTLYVNDTVTGATSGVTGTITAIGTNNIDIRLSSPLSLPLIVGEQIRKDASNYITNTTFRTRYYFHGTAAQLAAQSKNVYQTAKAINPSVMVMSPDFVDGYGSIGVEYDHITAWGSASDGAAGFGKNWADALSYHFYDFDSVAVDNAGVYRSLQTRLNQLSSVKSGLGVQWDIYGTEVGYTTGWQFYTTLASQPIARAGMLKRVALLLAAGGVKSCIFYNHEDNFCGNPSTVPEISNCIDQIANQYNGKMLYSAGFLYGNQGYSLTGNGEMVIST
jgi:hypothetical protein